MEEKKTLKVPSGGMKMIHPTLGCDPEFFFSKEGKVIGSEKIIKKTGIRASRGLISDADDGKIIRDGVQAELNPKSSTCRESLASNIKTCFIQILSNLPDGTKVNMSQMVRVPKDEFDSLSDDSKKFGCAESFNCYSKKKNTFKIDPKVNRSRSAGGHIHMGIPKQTIRRKYGHESDEQYERDIDYGLRANQVYDALHNPEITVPIMDLIVGNTCVLLDKGPNAKKRRKVYGRAGEHRKPKYGLEYRTLSNFWLKSYQLMSFVFGMSRFAVNIVAYSTKECDYVAELLERVDMEDVKKAINNNDFDLAYQNFSKIKDLLVSYAGTDTNYIPINKTTIKEFEYFITKPLSYWFKTDVVTHWTTLGDSTNPKNGWNRYSKTTIRNDPDFKKE